MTTTPEHPATVHLRSVALVQHALRGDHEAAAMLLGDITAGPEAAAAQIVSLTGLCRLLLSAIPAELREQLLNEAALHLAQAEDGPVA
ncbi:MAG: hypothetical protein ACRDS1_15950 [Pseudonocardiaceae bacterium]